ncbi:MAG: type IX secretion system sortase PorU [Cyclobacteriaceae bacterium]|nr:MAG: type IX secretion system sortase PorU [Cyclobacteriaceae bacterium]
MSASKFAFCLIFVLSTDLVAQTNSVLQSGNWFKFSVSADGVVRINYDLLRTAGVNPDQIDPRNIRIFTGQPGMLPQANNKSRKIDLTEIAIQVVGEQDGRFNSNDAILFFAQGPDQYHYNIQKQIFEYENNLFTDKNFYFLTIGTEPGKRITTRQSIAGNYPVITTYQDMAYYETEKYSLLKSGRQWFGEQFDASLTATIRFEISDIAENSQVKLVSHVMAQSITPSSFTVAYNNNTILTQSINAVPNTRYGVKGNIKADTVILNSNTIGASTNLNQDIRYQFTKGSSGISVGYLDFFLLTLSRKLTMRNTQLVFRAPESIEVPVSTYEIANATAGLQVWDVTNADQVVQQEAALTSGKLNFSAPSETLRTFVVINPSQVSAPSFEGVVPNQNLRGTPAPELLIITHQSFISEAQRLAAHRQQHSGLTAGVVTVDKIYNEYAGGKQDFSAIRDFIRSYYLQSGSALKHVLLFGRGSYDYKNRVLNNSNFVPLYESRNSLSPLETYSSDDYYAFMEESEGDWFESPAQNHTLDLGVGRLPVKTIEEAKAVVDKLIEYDTQASGSWQNEILFVADDGDFNIHHSQADQLATYVEQTYPAMVTRRFFVDSYEQITKPSGQSSPAAAKALDLAVRKGSLIVNFTGHGSERVWMDERILDEVMVKDWKNKPRYPLFVTATCEFGRHDDPLQITSGELTLLQPKGGSIGLVTSARPVNSSTNFTLNRAFYEALFTKENNQYPDLGSTFQVTKNNSTSGIANRNFSLLADPSMKLALPQNEIVFDEITTAAGSSTLTGLSKIRVKGHIENSGMPVDNFNGNLILSLFDEPVTQATKGDENSPFSYSELSTVFYRGQASVTLGEFETSFVLTKNVPANSSVGTLTGYAYTNSTSASGFNNSAVGGLDDTAGSDNTPPVVKLFMGDTTFISGGIVGPSTRIVALLYDANGINITNFPEGKQIYFALDDGEPQVINDYYLADVNTDKSGVLIYPLDGLEKGNHTLTLTVSDTHNNTTIVSVPFVVTDGSRIEIEEFVNYPNPFEGLTTFEFTHTRPGEDLEVCVSIVDLAGNKILEQHYEVLASQYRVTLAEWDGRSASGSKLSRGIYVGKLSVRSLLDGSKNEQFTKLIVLN